MRSPDDQLRDLDTRIRLADLDKHPAGAPVRAKVPPPPAGSFAVGSTTVLPRRSVLVLPDARQKEQSHGERRRAALATLAGMGPDVLERALAALQLRESVSSRYATKTRNVGRRVEHKADGAACGAVAVQLARLIGEEG